MISSLRNASRKAREIRNEEELKFGLNSSRNWLFYSNNNGKSTLALTQIDENVTEPVLCISAGGASMYLTDSFQNAVIKTISTIEEAEKMSKELSDNAKLIQSISQIIEKPEVLKQLQEKFIKKHYSGNEEEGKEDFAYLCQLAKEGRFIYSRVILEEIDIQSFWIQQRIESDFELNQIGENMGNRGKDWDALRKELINYYSRWLRLPCETIFCTPDKLPSEKQGVTQVVPSICTGSAHRMLISLIGNVLYVDNKDGKYYIHLKQTSNYLIRAKFFPMKTDYSKVPDKLDITNKPEEFWKYIDRCRKSEIDLVE